MGMGREQVSYNQGFDQAGSRGDSGAAPFEAQDQAMPPTQSQFWAQAERDRATEEARREAAASIPAVDNHKPSPQKPDYSWKLQGACRGSDPDLFHSEPGSQGDDEAKKTCGRCTVRLVCLEYALAKPEKEGVWGGLDERQRRRVLRQRRNSQS